MIGKRSYHQKQITFDFDCTGYHSKSIGYVCHSVETAQCIIALNVPRCGVQIKSNIDVQTQYWSIVEAIILSDDTVLRLTVYMTLHNMTAECWMKVLLSAFLSFSSNHNDNSLINIDFGMVS